MFEKINITLVEHSLAVETLEDIFKTLRSDEPAAEKINKIHLHFSNYTYTSGIIEGILNPNRVIEELGKSYPLTPEYVAKFINLNDL